MTVAMHLINGSDKKNIFLDDCHDEAPNIKTGVIVFRARLRVVEESLEEKIVLLREDVRLFAEVVAVYHVLNGPGFLGSERHHWICERFFLDLFLGSTKIFYLIIL